MDDIETCPHCKTTKYNKPNMKLMINVCAHVLCETCVEQLFYRGSGLCPKCNRLLKKSEFRDKIYEDNYIEKEVAIRKKYYKDLIRSENEFPSLREFNDYLETVESLIFNLANEIDEEQSIKKIEDLKKEAKESAKNRSRIIMEPKKENQLYKYLPYSFYHHGPNMPNMTEILQNYSLNMTSNSYNLACGFPPHVPVQRLLNDSFSDLYLTVRSYPTADGQ